jgi:phytoene dehydrogenase-like protein
MMKEYAIVGSGIGGSAAAALLTHKGHDTLLLEKEPYLGGCSSTFTHGGYRYNTGATTFAGYEEGHRVKELFDTLGRTPRLIETDPTLVVLQNDREIFRYRDIDRFLPEVDGIFPHPKNEAFWLLVHEINKSFYTMNEHYYSDRSLLRKLRSLGSFIPMLYRFRSYLGVNAEHYIKDYFGTISPDYLAFMEAQVLIVTQAPLSDINFFTAALALGYTFNKNHYVPGGMGHLFELLNEGVDTRLSTAVTRIERLRDRYLLHTAKDIYETKNVVLNSTVFDAKRVFDDHAIHAYYDRYAPLNNYQSAFVLYMTVKTKKPFHHHYQIIEETPFENTLSNALFVSFSDASDDTIAPEGHYSVTASVHTDLRWWSKEQRQRYEDQKAALQERLIQLIYDKLNLNKDEIVHAFSATPSTFGRYILRTQLGGNAMIMQNLVYRLPSNDTPVKGLYHIGDSVYPAQGWPGAVMGVNNFMRVIDD